MDMAVLTAINSSFKSNKKQSPHVYKSIKHPVTNETQKLYWKNALKKQIDYV